MTRVAVLEVGGTHATASWVDPAGWTVAPTARVTLHGDAPAARLLDELAGCLAGLGEFAGSTAAVAMPGPFDYPAGIGRFRGVGKFDALDGVDVGAGLRARLSRPPARIRFVNDAEAFGLGEWLVGAARGTRRAVAITLGTGIGSAFVDAGRAVSSGPEVPPDGHAYRLTVDGQPLESLVSRRAILARYGLAGVDVAEIAARAGAGEPAAVHAFVEPLRLLGAVLAPWLLRFGAEVLVVGGAMSGSWDLVAEALRAGGVPVPVRRAADPDASTAAGAAWHAVGGVEAPAHGVPAEIRDEKP